jgi:deoxycytidylate deaminase
MTKSATTKIKKCIEITKCLKKHRQTGRAFHCTFVYEKSKLLCIGINNLKKLHRKNIFGVYKGFKDNPEKYIASIHSEIDALIKMGKTDCSKLTFINVRIDNEDNVKIAKPCQNCMKVLQGLGFKNIFYTLDNGSYESVW